MGSAAIQGRLWGIRAEDWARVQEQTALPLHGAVLDAARVTTGTRVLDAGCGSGLTALLASLRGATVTAIDASAALVEIARQRLPDTDIREGDVEALPFADASFDAVIAVNSVFFAADPPAALSELVRVVRPDGRVVVTSWGRADQCDHAAVFSALANLSPPPPPGSAPGGPFALSEPGALEAMLTAAGLSIAARGDVACPFVYANAEDTKRGHVSTGVTQRAIGHSGDAAVLAALDEVDRKYMQDDGSIRYGNVFVWVAGVRP